MNIDVVDTIKPCLRSSSASKLTPNSAREVFALLRKSKKLLLPTHLTSRRRFLDNLAQPHDTPLAQLPRPRRSSGVFDLRGLLRRYAPRMVFLPETKQSKREMETILHAIGDYFGIFVDAKGRDGGLALLWNKDVSIDLLSLSLHHIDMCIADERGGAPWWFSGIYGWLES